jgi:hypothetical protein
VKVPLSDEVFIGVLHPVEAARQEYPFALAACFRLYNKGFRLLVIELELEVFGVLWEDPGRWEKVVVIRALPLHRLQITR